MRPPGLAASLSARERLELLAVDRHGLVVHPIDEVLHALHALVRDRLHDLALQPRRTDPREVRHQPTVFVQQYNRRAAVIAVKLCMIGDMSVA